ncbi:MAG: N-acetylmuramoyl-L-alanine amidase [Sumerlaeia bacterium]
MNNTLKRLCLALLILPFVGGCGQKSVPASAPTAKLTWQVPSPPAPSMVWVPAGSFRTGDRTPQNVTAIVIHTTEGRYNEEQTFPENQSRNFAGVVNYFKSNTRNVSAHYVLGPNGEICTMVNEKDIAHTQTYYNGRAFGIECAGWSSRPETWTPEMMESLVNLCAYLCVKWEIPAYQPEGTAYEGPWSLVVDEETKRFTGPGLVGHYQVQPWNKTDPGEHFPWEEFAERVRARIQEFGVQPIALPAPNATSEVVVTARIREKTISPGQPFTWVLTITGPEVNELTTNDVVFPDVNAIANVEQVSEPVMTTREASQAVFELSLKTTDDKPASLHAGRIKLRGMWYDSPTVTVRPTAVGN